MFGGKQRLSTEEFYLLWFGYFYPLMSELADALGVKSDRERLFLIEETHARPREVALG